MGIGVYNNVYRRTRLVHSTLRVLELRQNRELDPLFELNTPATALLEKEYTDNFNINLALHYNSGAATYPVLRVCVCVWRESGMLKKGGDLSTHMLVASL